MSDVRACLMCLSIQQGEPLVYCEHNNIIPWRLSFADKDAEIARLKAALREIQKVDAPTFGQAFGRCVDIANDALLEEK